MRLIIAATVAASLFATNLLAAEATGPLAPGKPAGVEKAQTGFPQIWYIVGGVAVLGAVVAAVGNSSGPQNTTPPTTG